MVDSFSDDETHVQIEEDVRGKDVFVIQPTAPPANQNLMELLIMIDALKRASAHRITAVMPYFGYARQDRKDAPRVPITAKLVANLIAAARADRVLTLDLHAHQIQGFFDIPLDHLYAIKEFIDHIKKQKLTKAVIVSPDVGGVKMARGYAARLGTDLAVIDKRRINDQQTEVMNILGDVEGRDAVIVDDIVSTAGSLVEAAAAIKEAGAKRIFAAITHGILSGPALERISDSTLEELWVTDSIDIPKQKRLPKIKVISVANLLGEAIKRIHTSQSISGLFRDK
jgi:ribose-phosphate pyrophosphokinase